MEPSLNVGELAIKKDWFYPEPVFFDKFKNVKISVYFFQCFSNPFQSVSELGKQRHDLGHSVIFP